MTDETRLTILSCALRLFASRGYDAVGVQEIVEAAGVTKPTLYHHFGSKHGLLETLLCDHFEELNGIVEQAAIYRGDLPLTLDQVAAAYFGYAKENPTFYRWQLSLYFAPPESDSFKAVAGFHERQYSIIEALFNQAVKQHGNMRGRHQRYALTFLGMINSYAGLWLNGYIRLDDELRYQAVHQFMHGIYS
jgi:TetR/AcrR family transcriptional regulator